MDACLVLAFTPGDRKIERSTHYPTLPKDHRATRSVTDFGGSFIAMDDQTFLAATHLHGPERPSKIPYPNHPPNWSILFCRLWRIARSTPINLKNPC